MKCFVFLQQDEDDFDLLHVPDRGAPVLGDGGGQHPHPECVYLQAGGPGHLPGCRHAEVRHTS